MILFVNIKRWLCVLLLGIVIASVNAQQEAPIFIDWHPNGEIIAVGHNANNYPQI